MSLEDKINQDYIAAMKARDTARSSALSFLRAQIKNVKVDKRIDKVPDEEVLAVIKRQIKQRLDSIKQFEDGGRGDLAEKEKSEMVLLQVYLPAQMPQEQLKVIVEQAIKDTQAASVKDLGKVIKEVVLKAAGKADNQAISTLAKEYLMRM